MRVGPSLTCLAALSLAACGQGAEPFPPSGATALARCIRTVAGTVADCNLLQESVPGSGAFFLEALRNFRPDPNDWATGEISMVFHLTVNRENTPPAP